MLLALQSAICDRSHGHPLHAQQLNVGVFYAIRRRPLGPEAAGCKPKLTRKHYTLKGWTLFTYTRGTRIFFLQPLQEIL